MTSCCTCNAKQPMVGLLGERTRGNQASIYWMCKYENITAIIFPVARQCPAGLKRAVLEKPFQVRALPVDLS
jgi:hypothetical protein